MQEGLLSCSIKSLNVNFDKSSTTLEKRVTSDRLVNLFNDGQAGNFLDSKMGKDNQCVS